MLNANYTLIGNIIFFISIYLLYKLIKHTEGKKVKKKYKVIENKNNNITTNYYQETYYLATHIDYNAVINDTGRYGEYLIFDYLKYYEREGGRFLFNCYLPKYNNETTEIDVMLICRNGIFVFESKNYSGWIFGNENSKYWTQTLPISKGRSQKNTFLNPIMQNNLHVRTLRNIIGQTMPIYSIIVFSERCTLKTDIEVNNIDTFITKRNELQSLISQICRLHISSITQEEIMSIYNKLYPYTQVTEEVKQRHIQNIHNDI